MHSQVRARSSDGGGELENESAVENEIENETEEVVGACGAAGAGVRRRLDCDELDSDGLDCDELDCD